MSYCPSCGTEIPADIAKCPNCAAVFGADSTWKPLTERPQPAPPSRAARVGAGVAKVILVMASLAMLLIGGLVAATEKGQLWLAACIITGFVVVGVAIQGRLRWTLLLLFISVALGFTSCAASFKWHGG